MPRKLEKCRIAMAAGRHVLVCYVKRSGDTPIDQSYGPLAYHELGGINSRSRWQRAANLVKYYFVLRRLMSSPSARSYDVFVDSMDLLVVALLLPKEGRRIRFEVRDLNKYQTGSNVAGWMYSRFESAVIRRVDMLILTSPAFEQQYYGKIYEGPIVVVENYPSFSLHKKAQHLTPGQIRPLRIGYVGFIRYLEPISVLIEAMEVLRGEGVDMECSFHGTRNTKEILKIRNGRPWVILHGPFTAKDVPDIYESIDLCFCVYDETIPNVRLAMPNKFYECLLSHTPIIVSQNTYLAQRVGDENVGRPVDGKSKEDMMNLLREAAKRDGWCSEVVRALGQLSKSAKKDHERSLKHAVLGVR